MISRIAPIAPIVLLLLPTLSAQSRSRATFLISGSIQMEDGTPCPEPVEVLLICTGAVKQRTFSQPGGQFFFQLANNKSPTTGETEIVGSPAGGFGSFNRLGRGFNDNGSFGTGRTSKFGRINLSDCEVTAALPGFTSDVIQLGIRDIFENPDVGAIVLHRRETVSGATISLKTLAAPAAALKPYRRAVKELAKKKPKFKRAARDLTRAVEEFEEFAAAWNLLGHCRRALKEDGAALEAFEAAVAADPEYLAPYLSLAELKLQQGEVEGSEGWSRKALERNPELLQAAYLNAFANYQLKRLDAAQTSILQVHESANVATFPGSHYLFGLILAAKGLALEASVEFDKFLALNPDFQDAHEVRQILAEWEDQGLIPRPAGTR